MAWLRYIGAALLIISAPLGWLNQPWGDWTRGVAWKPLSAPEDAKFALISLGTMLVVLALVALLPSSRRFALALSAAAFLVLLLPVRQVLFAHVPLCEKLSDDARQKSFVLQFDASALGGNVADDLDFPPISSENVLSRLDSLQHLIGWGWHVAALGVVLLAVSGWRDARRPLTVVLVVVLVVTLGSFRGLVAEFYQWRGDVALAKGNYENALRHYRNAARWNKSLDDTEHLRLSRGQCESVGNGRRAVPESADAHLYRAQVLADRRDFARAMEAYAQAHQRAPQSLVVKRLWAWARVRWGLNLYREGSVYLAIQQWNKAIETDAHQLQAHFYLAKAYYDARDEQSAVKYNLAFLKRCRDKFLRGEALSNLGDCYFRQRHFVTARQMYQKSLKQYDDISYRLINFRARRGLMGM
jgi:tetratricopeptide (TPR) repeat protein